MTPFDELTLQEVEDMTTECFDGKSMSEADPFAVAGGVMYMTRKRDEAGLTWGEFKRTTRMHEINAFAELMDEDKLDPTVGVTS